MEANENENKTVQTLWDAAKAVLREKYITIQAYFKKQEKSQIHNLTSYLKELEKKQHIKPNASRKGEIIKVRADYTETNKQKVEINETRN